MTAAELLHAAADHLQAVGLWKGGYWPGWYIGTPTRPYNPGDPCCGYGAILVTAGLVRADGYLPWSVGEAMQLLDVACAPHGFSRWNDLAATNRPGVCAKLRGVARSAQWSGLAVVS